VTISIVGPTGQMAKEEKRVVNQRKAENGGFALLGKFLLPKGRGTSVTISNQGTDGFVVADGVQFRPR
jgi:hypothetical protein